MYHTLKLKKLIEELNSLPIIRNLPMSDIKEVREKACVGFHLARMLTERSNNSEEAVNLLNKILLNINKNERD